MVVGPIRGESRFKEDKDLDMLVVRDVGIGSGMVEDVVVVVVVEMVDCTDRGRIIMMGDLGLEGECAGTIVGAVVVTEASFSVTAAATATAAIAVVETTVVDDPACANPVTVVADGKSSGGTLSGNVATVGGADRGVENVDDDPASCVGEETGV